MTTDTVEMMIIAEGQMERIKVSGTPAAIERVKRSLIPTPESAKTVYAIVEPMLADLEERYGIAITELRAEWAETTDMKSTRRRYSLSSLNIEAKAG